MTGGLLQLVALGVEDIYITGEPQITMFKMVYRRHSNFSIYDVNLPVKGRSDFDCNFIVKLDKMADLLHKMYLVVDLPNIYAQQELATNDRIKYLLNTVGITWTYTGSPTDIVTQTVYLRQIKPLINARIDEVTLLSNYYHKLVDRAELGFNIPIYAEIQLIIFYIFSNLLDTTGITYASVEDENYAKIQKCLFDGIFALFQDVFSTFGVGTTVYTTTLNIEDFSILLYNLYLPQVTEWNWYNAWYDGHAYNVHSYATEDAIFYFILKNQQYIITSDKIGDTIESYIDTLINNNYLYTTFLEPVPDPDPSVVNYDYETLDAYIIYKKYMNTLTTLGTNTITSQAQLYGICQNIIEQVNWNIYVNDKSICNVMTLLTNMYYSNTYAQRFRLGYFKRYVLSGGVYTPETTTFNTITKNTGLLDDYLYSVLITEDLNVTDGVKYRVRNDGVTAEYYTIAKPYSPYSYKFTENSSYTDTFVTNTLTNYTNTNLVSYIDYYQAWLRIIVSGTVMQGRLSNTTINNGKNFYVLFTSPPTNLALMNYIPYLTVRDIPFLVNELISRIDIITTNVATYHFHTDPAYYDVLKLPINLVDNDERTVGVLSAIDEAVKYYLYEQTAYKVITNSEQMVINDNDYINSINSTYIGTDTTRFLTTNIFRPEGLSYEYAKYNGVPPSNMEEVGTEQIYRPETWICGTYNNRYAEIITAIGFPADLRIALIDIVEEMVNTFITSYADMPTFSTYYARNRMFDYSTQTIGLATYTFTTNISFGLYSDAISSIYHIIQENTITSFNTLLTGSLLSSTVATATGNTSKAINTYYAGQFAGFVSNLYVNAVARATGFLTACTNVTSASIGTITDPLIINPISPIQSYMVVYCQANRNYERAYMLFGFDYLGYLYSSTGVIIQEPVYYFEYFLPTNKLPAETTYYMTKTYTDHLNYKYIDNMTAPDSTYVTSIITYANIVMENKNVKIFSPMDSYDTVDLTYVTAGLRSCKYFMNLGYTAATTPPQTNPYNSTTLTNLHTWYDTYLGEIINELGVNHEIIELAYLYMIDLCETQGNMTSSNLYNNSNRYKFFYGFIDYTNIVTYIATLIVNDTNLTFLYSSITNNVTNSETAVTASLQAQYALYSTTSTQILGVTPQNILGIQAIIVSLVYGVTPTFQWVPELGHRLIESAEIIIGSQSIEIHTDELLHLIHELDKVESQERGYNIMIGNTSEMTTLSSSQRTINKLYIPFQFWFCRHQGNSLPLICLLYADVLLKVKLRKMSEVLFVSPNVANINLIKQPRLKCSVLAQYVYLDDNERTTVAQSKLEYLIERFTYNGDYIIDQSVFLNNTQTFEMRFFLKDCIKYIIWTTKFYISNPSTLNQYYEAYNWNDYTFNAHSIPSFIVSNFYDRIKIKFNGQNRENYKEEIYYKYVQSTDRYGKPLNIGNYMYNFAIMPDIIQPSGSANFSQLDDSSLVCDLVTSMYNAVRAGDVYGVIKLWGRGYNILRVMSGLAGLAFTYSKS
jgi:hypothetical protein